MIRIAIDTCAVSASVAIQAASGVAPFVKTYPSGTKVADVLFADLQTTLEAASSSDARLDIQAIFVTIGPGSFTGQRLGLALAQGLAAAHPDARLYGPTSLHAAAIADAGSDMQRCGFSVIADARRGQFYLQSFDETARPASDCVLIDQHALQARLAVAVAPVVALDQASLDAVAVLGLRVEIASGSITSEALLMVTEPEAFGLTPVQRLRPLYLKPPDAAPSRPAGLRAAT